jgi:hypothetical protein
MSETLGSWSPPIFVEAPDPPDDPEAQLTKGPWTPPIPVGIYIAPLPEITIGSWSAPLLAPLYDPVLVNHTIMQTPSGWVAMVTEQM